MGAWNLLRSTQNELAAIEERTFGVSRTGGIVPRLDTLEGVLRCGTKRKTSVHERLRVITNCISGGHTAASYNSEAAHPASPQETVSAFEVACP